MAGALLALAMLLPGVARAGSDGEAARVEPVVVELFTSQGCSSCPPADALLGRLAEREDVIALGLHVDYWDYLGWHDAFGDRRFSDRQRGYARAAQRRTVYTPQAIVQGVTQVIGSREDALLAAIARHRAVPRPVAVRLYREDDSRVVVEISARRDGVGRSVVHLVRYIPEQVVRIEGGENAGKRVRYVNIVADWQQIAVWDGRGTLRTILRDRSSSGERLPIAVLVQKAGFGPILGAAVLR